MTPGGQLSKKMLEIIRAAQWLKTHAYDKALNDHVKVKMQDLMMLVQEGQKLMEEQEVLTLDLEGEEEDGGSSDFPVGSAGFGGCGAAGDAALLPPSPPSPSATP